MDYKQYENNHTYFRIVVCFHPILPVRWEDLAILKILKQDYEYI